MRYHFLVNAPSTFTRLEASRTPERSASPIPRYICMAATPRRSWRRCSIMKRRHSSLDGTLTNTAAILRSGRGRAWGQWFFRATAPIGDGTLSTRVRECSSRGGTLSGVTYDGTLNLSARVRYRYIATGLTATACTAMDPVNQSDRHERRHSFEGNQTFNNATINLGSTTGYARLHLQ